MVYSVASQSSLANNADVRQSITEADRFNHVRKHSWLKTFMMTNPITAPVTLFSELVSGTKRR